MLRKTISAGLAICLVFSLCSCKKTPDTVKTEEQQGDISFISVMLGDKNIEEWNENNVIANVSWNSLKLSEDDEAKFPNLQKSFSKYNSDALKNAKSTMYELVDAAKDLSGDDFNPVNLEGTTRTYMQRADTKIVSYLEDTFVYSGGVHPDYYYKTVNLDPKTGKELILTDVMSSIKGLPDILETEISNKYDYITFDDDQLWEIFKGYSADDYKWTIDYQGITFWFSPYDIAAYTVGPLSVKLYFDDNPNIIRDEYKTAPSKSFGIMLPKGNKIDFDLDLTDDKKDCIEIETKADDYGSYNILSVTVNGKTVIDEKNYAYDFDVYLVHIGNKNYIYSDSWSDNDYHMFNTWDINGDTPKIVQELYNTKLSDEYIEEGADDAAVYSVAFNNPASFKMEKRIEIMGTREIWANFKINETDGIPQITDDDYTFNEGHEVVLKIPMMAQVVPDMDKHELGEGMHLTPAWTDGETYVDLMTEDGWTVRFEIDISKWPRKVNGIPEDECFEELVYAR